LFAVNLRASRLLQTEKQTSIQTKRQINKEPTAVVNAAVNLLNVLAKLLITFLKTPCKTYKKFELMLTERAKAYSSSCSQTVSLSSAISSRLLRRYRSLMPSCAGFLESRKSRLRPSKYTFNAENSMCRLSMSISTGFSAIHSCNVSRIPKSPKNP